MEDQLFADREGKTTPESSVSSAASFQQWEKSWNKPQRHKSSVYLPGRDANVKFLHSSVTVPQNALLIEIKKTEKKNLWNEWISYPDAHICIHTQKVKQKCKHAQERTHIVHLSSRRGIYPQTAGIRHFNGSQWGFHGYSMYRNEKRGPSPRASLATGTNLHLKQGG